MKRIYESRRLLTTDTKVQNILGQLISKKDMLISELKLSKEISNQRYILMDAVQLLKEYRHSSEEEYSLLTEMINKCSEESKRSIEIEEMIEQLIFNAYSIIKEELEIEEENKISLISREKDTIVIIFENIPKEITVLQSKLDESNDLLYVEIDNTEKN